MQQPKWFVLIVILVLSSLGLEACSFSVQTFPTPSSSEILSTSTSPAPSATLPSSLPTFPPPSPTEALPLATPTLMSIRADTTSMLKIFENFELKDIVRGLAFTPNGTVLAAAGGNTEDFAIHLWDVVSGQSLGQLDGHTGIVWSLAFSPDGQMLASVSGDNTARIWDWRNKTLIKSLDFPSQVISVSFSPDGQTLAVGGVDVPQNQIQNATIWTFAVGSWQPRAKFAEFINIGALAYSPDGNWLVGGGTSRNVEVWRSSGGSAVRILNHAHQVSKAIISPDSSTVATGTCAFTTNDQCTEGSTWIWDLRTGKLSGKLAGFPDVVENLAYSADGSSLVAASRDGTIQFYDAVTYQPLFRYPFPGGISALALSPDSSFLAIGSPNGQIQIWSVVY